MTSDSAPSPSAYTLWAVLRRDPARPVAAADETELADVVALIEEGGTTVRGFYDVSGLRADADLMIWLHGPDADGLQRDLRRLRRTVTLSPLLPVWNAMGVHRDAEFNRSHVPGFLRGERARDWLCVYPFVRSYEWYLLPEAERRTMLAEHGRKGAGFTGVVANTVASFALGDYEWVLPMEADELTDLVDMMRDLRYTEARRHVREEVPFYTGRRIELSDIAEVLQ
ncbi:Putative heme-dependent peroxidase [Microbacterium lemovicicum]|uniref:Coproheme decarboxylase n=1 Tax=Microbacterium lemovicicum TaxID=1072463 RepID=A0A3S9WEA3_9MICO|nr:hydrogen peroxide-dependent heme synthase [Microbacterium lemovicicum]AZS38408.1 Putative heme-dependent peroxidase [Microbacterium lemovicicum]